MDEAVDVGGPGRLHDLLVARVRPRVGDVVADRAGKEPGVLEHHADPGPQVVPCHVGDVHAVEGDPARVQLVEAHDEVDERRLAGAGRADDGDRLARLDDEVESVDERLLRGVGERDLLERDATVRVVDTLRRNGVRLLLRGVEDGEDPLGGRDTRLQEVGHRRHLGQRLGELAGVLDEGLHVTEGHGPARNPQSAEHGDDDVVEVPDEHHRRHDDAADELRPEGSLVEVVVLDLEGLLRLLLTAEDLDEAVPGEGLLDDSVELAGVLPLLDEELLRALGDRRREGDRDGDRHQGDEREHPGDAEHHRDHGHDGEHRGEQLAEGLLEARLDVVDVVRHPAEQLTTWLTVEVGQRQPVELGLDVLAEGEDGALDHRCEQPAGEPLQERRDDVEAHDEEEHLPESGEVDAHTGDDIHPGQQVGQLALTTGAQALDDRCLARTRRQPGPEVALEDEVGRVAEDLRPDGAEDHADHRQHDDDQDQPPLGSEPADDALGGRAKVLGLLPGQTHLHVTAAATCGTTRPAPGLGRLLLRALDAFLAHAAAPSADRWDWTISW